jgi:hypothetical protein
MHVKNKSGMVFSSLIFTDSDYVSVGYQEGFNQAYVACPL